MQARPETKYQMEEQSTFQSEFVLIIIGAIIFTASFLWKDFISDLQEYIFPKTSGIVGRFLFVIVATVILVSIAVKLKNSYRIPRSSNLFQFDDGPIGDSSDDTSI